MAEEERQQNQIDEAAKPVEKMSAWGIVEKMMDQDAFSKWLGIELVIAEPGFTKVKITIKAEMLNGFDIGHGGICYSLADSAMAFASNSRGNIAVTTNTNISHFMPVKVGDTITAEARESHRGERIAHYNVTLINQDEEHVAAFNGSVFRTEKIWIAEE